MQLIEDLKWRYATKHFDTDKKVSDKDILTMKQAINLTATSFGLQPFRVFCITDPALKEELQTASFNQAQISECSHLFVFCAKTEISESYVDAFIQNMAETRNVQLDDLKGYGDYIKGSVNSKPEEFIAPWNIRQAYIALGSLLIAAANLRVDACPMEGFQPEVYSQMLDLESKGLTAAVVCPVGYRSPDDKTAEAAKVRLDLGELFIDK